MLKSKANIINLLLMSVFCSFCYGVETKAGKITSLSLDTKTDLISVTVTTGTFSKESRSFSEVFSRQKSNTKNLITLSDETVKINLDEQVKIVPFMPANGKRSDNEKPFERNLALNKLNIGDVVQLVYDADGKDVVEIKLFMSQAKTDFYPKHLDSCRADLPVSTL